MALEAPAGSGSANRARAIQNSGAGKSSHKCGNQIQLYFALRVLGKGRFPEGAGVGTGRTRHRALSNSENSFRQRLIGEKRLLEEAKRQPKGTTDNQKGAKGSAESAQKYSVLV